SWERLMGAFSAEWLALREPADQAARSLRLTRIIVDRLGGAGCIRALDLGTGTGANVRYLSAHLPPEQAWLLVDENADVLAAAARGHRWAAVRRGNLARDMGSSDRDLFARRTLVTASALLDLVSESWLRALAARAGESLATVLFALTYDGSIRCDPPEE